MKLSIKKLFTPENFAVVIMVLFCIRYIPLETRSGVSNIKTLVSFICCGYLLMSASGFSKALIIGLLYWVVEFINASAYPESFRWSTLLYSLSLVLTFCCFYNLVWLKNVFTIDRFIRIVKYFIYAYCGVLILQQMCIIVGIRHFALINFTEYLGRGLGANSLSGEPSTFARILTVLMYAYIKCSEYRQGAKLGIKQMFNLENKWVTILYIYSILTMGSGTAFLCIAVLSLYFFQLKSLIVVIPLYIGAFYLLSNSNIEGFNRAHNAVEATMTGDTDKVSETDGSAAARINPMLNTLNIDLSDSKTWFGHGIDWSNKEKVRHSSQRYIGEIGDYGLIVYLLGLLLVFSCCINFFSLATIMFFLGIGGGTGNIAYMWGILMVFSCIKYFDTYKECDFIFEEEIDEQEIDDSELILE